MKAPHIPFQLTLIGLLLATPSLIADAVFEPSSDDIPKPVPARNVLAGDEQPDIGRFLKVQRVVGEDISPDGRHVTYITSITGQPQLWSTEVASGTSKQLTFLDSSVTFQSWSPAGNWIAYGTDREGNGREGFYLVSLDGFQEREICAPSEVFRVFGGWSPDGRQIAFASTERNGVDFDIYTVEIAKDGRTAQPKRVYEGKGGLYVAGWSQDGKWLALTQARGEADNDIALLEIATGKLNWILRPEDAASYSSMSWAGNSKGFYVATNQDRDLAGLGFYDVALKELRWIDTPDAEVESVDASRDGRFLAWTLNGNGYSSLHLRDLRRKSDGGRMRVPGLPEGIYTVKWAENSRALLIRIASPQVPGDLWVWQPGSREAKRVTYSSTAGLRPETFINPESISFTSWDGETVHGLLYLPLRRESKSPVLIHLHGGPTSQARPQFQPDLQYLLTRGIAILDLNYRGSTGYGKRYTRLDNQRLRLNGVKDIGSAIDWLETREEIDASRVAVMGGSYGGYLTCAAVTEFPDRFKAGVNIVGVCNWIRALEDASPQLKASDVIEYGNINDPEDRKFFESISPIKKADQIKAPLMVLHGVNDPQVPIGEADELVGTIRKSGGKVEYLRFPDEGHGFRKLSNQIIAFRRVAAFLEEHLGD